MENNPSPNSGNSNENSPSLFLVPVFYYPPGYDPSANDFTPMLAPLGSLYPCYPQNGVNMYNPAAALPNLNQYGDTLGGPHAFAPSITLAPSGLVSQDNPMPVHTLLQDPLIPPAVRGPPVIYNFIGPSDVDPTEGQEMCSISVPQDSQVPSLPTPCYTSENEVEVVHPRCSNKSITLSSDVNSSCSQGAPADEIQLDLGLGFDVPRARFSTFPANMQLQAVSFPQLASGVDDEKEVREKRWVLLVRKELRNTDVGHLGRIVLPKKDAEANLPALGKTGVILEMKDPTFSIYWRFKYRFWPNNKSRMYVMENTGNFIKMHNLHPGDLFTVYKEDSSGTYIVCGKKVLQPSDAEMSQCITKSLDFADYSDERELA